MLRTTYVLAVSVLLACLACLAGFAVSGLATAEEAPAPKEPRPASSSAAPTYARGWRGVPLSSVAQRGIKWLVISQNADGGWGQEGARHKGTPQRTSPGWQQSDVGNTSLALLGILATGSRPGRGTFQGPLKRGVGFLLREIEQKRRRGAAITDRTGTQLQGKIGRYAGTYLAARVLLDVDGSMPTKRGNARVRKALTSIVAKIEAAQSSDGSWNGDAGWAPIHSTAYASQALVLAKARGYAVSTQALERVERFTVRQLKEKAWKARPTPPTRRRRGRPPVVTPSGGPSSTDLGPISVGGAGIVLYSLSQGIEQFSRTPASRKRYAKELKQLQQKVTDPKILKGFGSVGGEEFISYANIALALARLDTQVGRSWLTATGTRLAKIQNRDGSWSGHHCITGRTAVTGLAVLTLTAERAVPRTSTKVR